MKFLNTLSALFIIFSSSLHASGGGFFPLAAPATIVMRHGHRIDDMENLTVWAELVNLRIYHRWNPPLSVPGQQDIESSVNHLISSGAIPTQIYASPMLRTLQSAAIAQRIIHLRTGRLIPVRIDQQFQEWRFAFTRYYNEAFIVPELNRLPDTFVVDREYISQALTQENLRIEALEANRLDYRRRVAGHIQNLERQNPAEQILIIGHVETVLTALNVFHLNGGVRHVDPGAYVRIIRSEHLFFSERGVQRDNASSQ